MGTDEELAARLGEGDAAALEALVGRYEHALSGFLSRRTGGRDVEDLYQETWLRVVRAAPRFDAGRRFSTWLFQIATNLCRDWWRRHREEGAAADLESAADPRPSDPSDAIAVESLLAKLPDLQREALVLRYYLDASEAEMSDILGCPRGTVKSRIHNALQRLGEIVSADACGSTAATAEAQRGGSGTTETARGEIGTAERS